MALQQMTEDEKAACIESTMTKHVVQGPHKFYGADIWHRSFAEMVEEFHRKVLKYEPHEKRPLTKEEFDIHWKAFCEEMHEFSDSYNNSDYIGSIDAVIDLMYFGMGSLVKMGLSAHEIDRCISAVHKANMEKKLGVVECRGDGSVADAIKPDGWVSPEERIAEIVGAKSL